MHFRSSVQSLDLLNYHDSGRMLMVRREQRSEEALSWPLEVCQQKKSIRSPQKFLEGMRQPASAGGFQVPFLTAWSPIPLAVLLPLPPSQQQAEHPWPGHCLLQHPHAYWHKNKHRKVPGRRLSQAFHIAQERLCRCGWCAQALCSQLLHLDSSR